MNAYTLEGVVLRSIDYLKSQKILTLLTREHGLISLYVHGVNGRNLAKANLCTPLSRGLFHTEKGQRDFYVYKDGSLLDGHLFLRENWRALQCACDFVKAILRSQLHEKPTPLLYQLLCSYLGALQESTHLDHLKVSFWLKLLKHEGIYAPAPSHFTAGEQALIDTLAHARHFKEIDQMAVPTYLVDKVALFFEMSVKNG